jgi:O-antigen/teichoic acid export membrane protein
VVIAIYPILVWQGKTEFMNYWPLMLILVFGAFLMNVSLIYHSYLYIMHREKKLLEIVMISGIVNIISTLVLCKFYGLYGAGAAFIITAGMMYYLRRAAATKMEKI